MAKITPSRLAAFEILKLVGEGKGHSDELLHSARVDALSPEDRNLTTALVMGVLRWQIALDARVRGLLQRPEQRLAEPVAIALRMGAFQLLHLERIPAHAALILEGLNVDCRSSQVSRSPRQLAWQPIWLSSRPRVEHGVPVKDSAFSSPS